MNSDNITKPVVVLGVKDKNLARAPGSTLYRMRCLVFVFSSTEKNDLVVKKKQHFLYVLFLNPAGFSKDLLLAQNYLGTHHFKSVYSYEANLWEVAI